MTQCNPASDVDSPDLGSPDHSSSGSPIQLSKIGRREVVADFDGGRLTSDAGLLLLREVDQQIGLTDAINEAIPDPRAPGYIVHEQRELLAQRLYALAAGYEDGNDHDSLRHDPTLQTAAGRQPETDEPLASPATLCRLENRITRKTIVRLHKVLLEQFFQAYEQVGQEQAGQETWGAPPESITLDLDATDDRVYCQQEGRFYHGYYKGYCYLPLYVFAGEHLLVAYLRRSNIDAVKHARAVVKLLVDAIRERWPEVKITIRGDSGFCRWKLMRWCDKNDVTYIFGLARNKVLQKEMEPLFKEVEAWTEATGVNRRRFHEFQYEAGSWDRERRVIGKAEVTGKGRNPRFIVTNEQQTGGRSLYETGYCERGEMENHIKDQQLSLFADRTSCSSMLGNQFRLLLSGFASVLYERLRKLALQDTKLEQAEPSTIRVKLIKIAARVSVTVRRVVFHLASSHPAESLFRLASERLARRFASVIDTG